MSGRGSNRDSDPVKTSHLHSAGRVGPATGVACGAEAQRTVGPGENAIDCVFAPAQCGSVNLMHSRNLPAPMVRAGRRRATGQRSVATDCSIMTRTPGLVPSYLSSEAGVMPLVCALGQAVCVVRRAEPEHSEINSKCCPDSNLPVGPHPSQTDGAGQAPVPVARHAPAPTSRPPTRCHSPTGTRVARTHTHSARTRQCRSV